MAETRGKFDVEGFYHALDSVRIAKKFNWKQVAEDTSVPASTLTRMSQGKRPDVDTLAALADWSGLNPAEYINTEPGSALSMGQTEPLALISSCLHNDPNLDVESAKALDVLVKTAYERMRKD